MILGIDTSSALTTVAVLNDDQVLASAQHDDARQHGEVLAVLIEQVLAQVGTGPIDGIACGVGPGPYTGLRVGLATAAALGLAWQVPVWGACSLDALAHRLAADQAGPFVVASDARRREVYWAAYDSDGIRQAGPFVGPAAAVDEPTRHLRWFGEGAALAADAVHFTGDGSRPTATDVAHLVRSLVAGGEVVDSQVPGLSAHGTDDGSTAAALAGRRLLPPMPLYVRRPDAVGG